MSEETTVSKKPRGARSKPKSADGRKIDRRVVHERCPVMLSNDELTELNMSVEGIATDIGPRGIGLITNNPLSPNTSVMITLQGRYFTHEFKAVVIWCRELPSCGKIIKVAPYYSWRMGLMFLPQNEDERKLLLHIFEKL